MGGDPTHVGCLMTLSMTDLCFSNSLIPVTTSLSMGWGVPMAGVESLSRPWILFPEPQTNKTLVLLYPSFVLRLPSNE
jgi:hypothetical protein